ncbi:MAG: hypothetical protein MI864_04070 [Pseudomonadales bacterium]|nr:hypothetical protein [Pseudomonadales bacterium]
MPIETYFINGHLDLSDEEFKEYYVPQIESALSESARFVVGDARGADCLAQAYLAGKTASVTVYHMYNSPRNNAGFKTKGGFESDNSRDRQMTLDSTQDIAWVRQNRNHSGTQRNLDRRIALKVN